MPYHSTDELPHSVTTNLPEHAQEIWKEAFNSAEEQHSNESEVEKTAAKIAWDAVNDTYEKGDDGQWHKREG